MIQNNVIQNNVIQSNVIQNNVIQNNVIQNNVIQNNVIQNNVIQNNVIQNNVIQNNVIQNNVVRSFSVSLFLLYFVKFHPHILLFHSIILTLQSNSWTKGLENYRNFSVAFYLRYRDSIDLVSRCYDSGQRHLCRSSDDKASKGSLARPMSERGFKNEKAPQLQREFTQLVHWKLLAQCDAQHLQVS